MYTVYSLTLWPPRLRASADWSSWRPQPSRRGWWGSPRPCTDSRGSGWAPRASEKCGVYHIFICTVRPSKLFGAPGTQPMGDRTPARQSKHILHCKKRLAVYPSPAGMSLTKLSLAGNNIIYFIKFIYLIIPRVVSLRCAPNLSGIGTISH